MKTSTTFLVAAAALAVPILASPKPAAAGIGADDVHLISKSSVPGKGVAAGMPPDGDEKPGKAEATKPKPKKKAPPRWKSLDLKSRGILISGTANVGVGLVLAVPAIAMMWEAARPHEDPYGDDGGDGFYLNLSGPVAAIVGGFAVSHLVLGIVLLSVGAAMHRESDRLRDGLVGIPLIGLSVSRDGESAMLTMRWSF